MAKYDFLLRKALSKQGVTILEADAPNKKSRPTASDDVVIFTDAQKFNLLDGVIFENRIGEIQLTSELDFWAVFADNGKLYIIWEYQTLRRYFPNCKAI